MADESSRADRLVNFISEKQLDEVKRTRGERVEDGTAQRDRPLYEILKENKDKKDAEFNERFKHRPPKALDEDETEFLEKLELSRREYEQQMADEEAEQLRSFQAAVAAESSIVHKLKETASSPVVKFKQRPVGKKNETAHPFGMIIKVEPQAKKAKVDKVGFEESADIVRSSEVDTEKHSDSVRTTDHDTDRGRGGGLTGLVSYSDESEEDE